MVGNPEDRFFSQRGSIIFHNVHVYSTYQKTYCVYSAYLAADYCLCFRYSDSAVPLLSKSEISSLCGCAALFVSDLVGIPEDRFSLGEAQMSVLFILIPFQTTPRPLYNTIVGVQANFRVSYPIRVITRVKCKVTQQTIWGSALISAISKTVLYQTVLYQTVIKRLR